MASEPSIRFPGPSEAETALQNEQVKLLRDQRDILSEQIRQQNLLAPLLWNAAGVKPIYGEAANLPELQGKLDDLRAKLEKNPKNAALQTQVRDAQARVDAGKKQIQGFEEIPNELQSLRQQIEKGGLDRSLAALKGELPVNPALLRDLSDQEAVLNESLRKQLGPGYEQSTAGQNALGEFLQRKESLLDASRRDDLSLGEALSISRQGSQDQAINNLLARASGINQQGFAGGGALGQVIGGYNFPLARMMQEREGQFGARALQFQYDADNPFTGRNMFRSFQTDVRTFGGAAMGAASTARLKKDIVPLDRHEYKAMQKVRDMPITRWRYLWESDDREPHIGPILEATPKEIRADDTHLSLLDYLGLTTAAVKELDRDVQTLRKAVGGKR